MTPTLASVIRDAIDTAQAGIYVSLPATVEAYDATTQTASVQPILRIGYIDEAGERQSERLPVITDVPLLFQTSGGWGLTFPVSVGDTVWLNFSSASLDQFLARGGSDLDPEDDRRQHLSDAVAIPGLRSRVAALGTVPDDRVRLGQQGGPALEITTTEVQCGGTASLALHAELVALRGWAATHIHTDPVSGVTTAPTIAPPTSTGTAVTKGS